MRDFFEAIIKFAMYAIVLPVGVVIAIFVIFQLISVAFNLLLNILF